MGQLNWQFIDFSGKVVSISFDNHHIGQLRFFDSYSSNAIYTTDHTKVALIETGVSKAQVLYNGEYQGVLKGKFFSPTLSLKDGRTFSLRYNFLGTNLKWVDSTGDVIMNFVPASLASRGKGTISTKDSITIDQREILLSSGLFAQKMMVANFALLAPFMFALFLIVKVWVF